MKLWLITFPLALSMTACGDASSIAANASSATPIAPAGETSSAGIAGPARPADPANPLLGSWQVVNEANCPFIGVTFSTEEMTVHFAATMASGPFDRSSNVYYQVNDGEVIVHDKELGANAPTYEFENENQVRLGGTEGTCVFRRV